MKNRKQVKIEDRRRAGGTLQQVIPLSVVAASSPRRTSSPRGTKAGAAGGLKAWEDAASADERGWTPTFISEGGRRRAYGGEGYRRSTTHWRLSTRHFHPKTALNTLTPCPPEKCTRSTRIECTRLVLKKISFQMLYLPSWLQLLLSHEVQLVSETLGRPKPSFPS